MCVKQLARVETQAVNSFNCIFCRTRHFVKNCEESEISPYLRPNKLAYRSFTDTGKKAQDSWVREKCLYYSQHNRRHGLCVHTGSSGLPRSDQAAQGDSGKYCTCSWHFLR